MELYDIYNNCSQIPFMVIAHLYFIFIALDLIAMLQTKTESSFFIDIIRIKFDNYKLGALFISLISFILSFIILFSNNQFVIMLGCEDLKVMPEGTYCYYVYATSENDKTYTLPAKIIKPSQIEYGIDNVYFKNAGYLYFSDYDFVECDEKFSAWDQNNKDWEIELTSKKTQHTKVKETNPFKPLNLIFPFVEILVIFTATIIYVFKLIKLHRRLT